MNRCPEPPHVQFTVDVPAENRIRSLVTSIAHQCGYIAERFRFHEHIYAASTPIEPLQLLKAYLRFLDLRSKAPGELREIPVERAYDMLAELFRWDLARQEELVTEKETQVFVQTLRNQTEPWAILAFTNIDAPDQRAYRLGSYPCHRVVADVGVEGGVILIGAEELAMTWFVDDDGPNRGIFDRRER